MRRELTSIGHICFVFLGGQAKEIPHCRIVSNYEPPKEKQSYAQENVNNQTQIAGKETLAYYLVSKNHKIRLAYAYDTALQEDKSFLQHQEVKLL